MFLKAYDKNRSHQFSKFLSTAYVWPLMYSPWCMDWPRSFELTFCVAEQVLLILLQVVCWHCLNTSATTTIVQPLDSAWCSPLHVTCSNTTLWGNCKAMKCLAFWNCIVRLHYEPWFETDRGSVVLGDPCMPAAAAQLMREQMQPQILHSIMPALVAKETSLYQGLLLKTPLQQTCSDWFMVALSLGQGWSYDNFSLIQSSLCHAASPPAGCFVICGKWCCTVVSSTT